MESKPHNDQHETLLMTKHMFSVLLDRITTHFKASHPAAEKYKDAQLYGFGSYDPEKPSLKQDFEQLLKGYVNGKYLYNKHREAVSGKPMIKISREYKFLFFNYLGYKSIVEFMASDTFTTHQREEQQALLTPHSLSHDYYYVCYYFGEDSRMNKGQVILYNNWKNVEMIYVYTEENGAQEVYTFYGDVRQSEDFAHFDTKFYVDGKKKEGAKFICFIGKSSPNERHYLMGTYSGFDKYGSAIAGKLIMKKYNTKADIVQEVNSPTFDPIICLELNKNRMVIESHIRKNPLLFSKKSPYAEILMQSAGDYRFRFEGEGIDCELQLRIEKYHYNIVSLHHAVIIKDDKVSIINKGQILKMDLSIYGVFHLQKVTLYLPAVDFIAHDKAAQGSFNGVDMNNNIVRGNYNRQIHMYKNSNSHVQKLSGALATRTTATALLAGCSSA